MEGLSLKNIKTYPRLSEETTCFSASLYLNGKKVADLSNRGCGGCDNQYFTDRDAERAIFEWFKAQPLIEWQTDGGSFHHNYSLEDWTCDQLNRHEFLKAVRKKAKKCLVAIIADGSDLAWPKIQPSRLSEVREAIEKKWPGVLFADEMSDDQIRAIYK